MVKKAGSYAVRIDLIKLIKTVFSKVLLIILGGLLAGAALFSYTVFFVQPKYQTSVSFYVNASSFSFGISDISISSSDILTSSSLVNSYTRILKSRTTLEAIIADSGVSYDYITFRNEVISTESDTDSPSFDVKVTSASPQEAVNIANSIAKILPERIGDIIEGASVRVLDYATLPKLPSSPSYMKAFIMGAFAGAITVSAFIIISSIVKETKSGALQGESGVKELFPELNILAVIPDMDTAEKKGFNYSTYYVTGRRNRNGQRKGHKQKTSL